MGEKFTFIQKRGLKRTTRFGIVKAAVSNKNIEIVVSLVADFENRSDFDLGPKFNFSPMKGEPIRRHQENWIGYRDKGVLGH